MEYVSIIERKLNSDSQTFYLYSMHIKTKKGNKKPSWKKYIVFPQGISAAEISATKFVAACLMFAAKPFQLTFCYQDFGKKLAILFELFSLMIPLRLGLFTVKSCVFSNSQSSKLKQTLDKRVLKSFSWILKRKYFASWSLKPFDQSYWILHFYWCFLDICFLSLSYLEES